MPTGMAKNNFSLGDLYKPVLDSIRRLRYLPLRSELREQWHYCNIIYSLICYIIEELSGSRLAHFFQQNIWDPLEMGSTFLSGPRFDQVLKAAFGVKSTARVARFGIAYGDGKEGDMVWFERTGG